MNPKKIILPLLITILISGCISNNSASTLVPIASSNTPQILPEYTPLPTRPQYSPGELVSYTAQTGDTLPVLAKHFNSSVDEILRANPIIPDSATTMPAGLPMEIPIYYRNFWGSAYQIIPDSEYVNGPAVVDFDTQAFIEQFPGWLLGYSEFAEGGTLSAAEVINRISLNYSISPKVLIALIEYQSGGLSSAVQLPSEALYPLGNQDPLRRGLYLQLSWAANHLNNGYYGWRGGELIEFDRSNGTLDRPDPWQNAASVAFHILFNELHSGGDYGQAIGPNGIARTYTQLFGNPWDNNEAHIPGSLTQPGFILPFSAGDTWSFTGGPHAGWGSGEPLAALDFASPSETVGCNPTSEFALAIARGLVVRSETGIVVLDLDEDGDERTGWVIFYLHLATVDRAEVGTILEMGEPIGHPSCEGVTSTGTHAHLARKYNGEWIRASGTLAFNMEGWIPEISSEPYGGTLTRFNQVVTACVCANAASQITSTGKIDFIVP